jgi:hypothetical protein
MTRVRTMTSVRDPKRVALLLVFVCGALVSAQRGGGRGGPGGPPQDPKAAAPIDLTGYWVSVVTEDWRYRMVTPTKGDYQGVPMTPDAVKIADAWDPAADTAAGNQCKSYGAAAIMRVPGRVRITWDDDRTLKLEADAGTQTRVLRFEKAATKSEPSWQGDSLAQWETPGGRGGGPGGPGGPGGRGGAAAPRFGALKVVTTNLKAGYLRKNGVPYSGDATVTEYFDVVRERTGDQLLVVTTVVDDPKYLRQPFIVSSQFKKQADAKGWEPTPCSSTW